MGNFIELSTPNPKEEQTESPTIQIAQMLGVDKPKEFNFKILSKDRYGELRQQSLDLLTQKQFSELDQLLEGLMKDQSFSFKGSASQHQLILMLSEDRELRQLVAEWAQSTGSTHALTTQGFIQTDLAWESRGGGWASSVTEEGWKGFRYFLTEAYRSLAEAMELAPENVSAKVAMMSVAMGLGAQPDQIKALCAQAEVSNPGDTNAFSGAAYALLPRWLGNADTYVDFLTTGFQDRPNSYGKFRALYNMVRLTSDWGDQNAKQVVTSPAVKRLMDSAVRTFSTQWPETDRFIFQWAELNKLMGHSEGAIRIATQGLKQFPESPDLLYIRGSAYVNEKRFKEAVNDLRAALDGGADQWRAAYNLANAYYQTEEYEKAKPVWLATLERMPLEETRMRASVHRRLCHGAAAMNEHEFGIKHGNLSVELNPEHGHTYYFRGYVFMEMGNKERAKEDFLMAILKNEDLERHIDSDAPGWRDW